MTKTEIKNELKNIFGNAVGYGTIHYNYSGRYLASTSKIMKSNFGYGFAGILAGDFGPMTVTDAYEELNRELEYKLTQFIDSYDLQDVLTFTLSKYTYDYHYTKFVFVLSWK